jgi:hypothetical protein
MQSASHIEYLLVEAKSHASEIRSSRGAKPHGGLRTIQEALGETIKAHGYAVDVENWLRPGRRCWQAAPLD